MLERFGLASGGGQRLYDQPMGVLAHVVERDGAMAGPQSVCSAAGDQLLLAEPHHGAKGELQQPLTLTNQPFAPALFADSNVVDEPALVEIGGRSKRSPAAFPDQGVEPGRIAIDRTRGELDCLALTDEGILAQRPAQPE